MGTGRKCLVTAGLLAAFVVVGVAGAPAIALGLDGRTHAVAPNASQRAAILKAWAGATPSRGHAACLIVRLAASDHAYGTVRLRATRACSQRWGFNGVNVLKRSHAGRWRVVFEGSAFSCPVAHIPRQVQRDLGICP